MQQTRCVIVSAAPLAASMKELLRPGDYLIACDGGYQSTRKILGREPDVILGDFDSAPEPEGTGAVVLPRVKDDTDTHYAAKLAVEKGFEDEFRLLCLVEKLGPQVFAEEKGNKTVCANVDLYSGLIYKMLGISQDLYPPLFAISRIPGWCAHRIEEVVFANRIIRPAYKYLGVRQKYKTLEERG